MKKIIALALTAVLAVSSLAACGNDKEENPKTDTTVNQLQSNDPGNNNSSADPNLPRVWLMSRSGTYENGAWAEEGYRYERNAYGLYTSLKAFDENGKEVKSYATVSETYDEENRLTAYSDGYLSYSFTYDASGKMTGIHVWNDDNEDLLDLTCSADGGYCAKVYDDDYADTYETSVYDENLNRISYESVRLGKPDLSKTFTYNSAGLVATENGADYQVVYTYDSSDRLVKRVKTETLTVDPVWSEEYTVSWEYIDEYTYSAAGNLLKHTGIKYGDSGYPDGLMYAFEEYTDADYDEQGDCLYHYDVEKNTWTGEYTFEKKASESVITYEYADEGWLLRENYGSDGVGFTVYDKDGNVVVRQYDRTRTYGYQEYAIIDQDLLLAFYELYGDEFVVHFIH